MISIVFGLATALCFAAGSLMASRTVRIIGPMSSVAWTMAIGLLVTMPFVALSGMPESVPANAGWLALIGLGNVSGLLLASSAYRFGKVGVITPILATEGALAAVIAALLGQSIVPIVGALLLVIVIGIVMAAAGPDPAPLDHERPLVAVLLATGAAALFGASLFAAGHASSDVPISWVLLPARMVGVLVLFVPLLVTRRLQITRSTMPLVIGMAFAEVIGFTAFSIGAQYDVAVTSVLASQFAPLSAVLAYFLFKEKLGRMQIAGVVVILVGVTALSLVS
ncbi:MAG: EamA family transporter [Actinomycetes bacterium]